MVTQLDRRRSAAFAAADPAALAEVYLPGAALRVDSARIAQLASAGERVLGLQLRYLDVRVIETGAAETRLAVTDELGPYRRVNAQGDVLQQYAGRGRRRWHVTLRRDSDGWRIAALALAPGRGLR